MARVSNTVLTASGSGLGHFASMVAPVADRRYRKLPSPQTQKGPQGELDGFGMVEMRVALRPTGIEIFHGIGAKEV
jgi:hypothetical protein